MVAFVLSKELIFLLLMYVYEWLPRSFLTIDLDVLFSRQNPSDISYLAKIPIGTSFTNYSSLLKRIT